MEQEDLKCKDRVDSHFRSRFEALKDLWAGYCEGDEGKTEEFYNYGLSFDYVKQNTLSDKLEGYFRYQISWGGPSDEFRFFTNPDFSIHRIEYWFLDWFDGANILLIGNEFDLLADIFENMVECGTVEHVFKEASVE